MERKIEQAKPVAPKRERLFELLENQDALRIEYRKKQKDSIWTETDVGRARREESERSRAYEPLYPNAPRKTEGDAFVAALLWGTLAGAGCFFGLSFFLSELNTPQTLGALSLLTGAVVFSSSYFWMRGGING